MCVACALREHPWPLGCTTGHGHKPRARTVTARQQDRGLDARAQATRRGGLPATAPVVRGDAAGRAGCGRHRCVQGHGIPPQVVEASALEGTRRRRRAQSAGWDVRTVRRRSAAGRAGASRWQGGQGARGAAGEHRHRPRPWPPARRSAARRRPASRVRRRPGRRGTRLHVARALGRGGGGEGAPRPPGRRRRGRRGEAHHPWRRAPSAAGAAARRAPRQAATDARIDQVRQGMPRQGRGSPGAWWGVRACVSGRAGQPRRAVGGGAGGPPPPSHRGARARAHGSPQAGTRPGRWMPTEWAWRGRRVPPDRARRGWWRARCGRGGKRWRRRGRVAVARQGRMARWGCRETGGRPAGAVLNAVSTLG